ELYEEGKCESSRLILILSVGVFLHVFRSGTYCPFWHCRLALSSSNKAFPYWLT
ncbi:hypothetical protein SCA6_009965, partial [Theobroma cacao]